DKPEVEALMQEHNTDRSKRVAQKRLAYEVTKVVHGDDRANSVVKLSDVLFGNDNYKNLAKNDFELLEQELKTVSFNDSLLDLIVEAELASSKGEARRFVQSGAIYVNGEQIVSDLTELDSSILIDGYAVIRRGKNTNALVRAS
ncbi:MAG: hypothetical protein MJK04_35710, partial [Psychrosphaera sp.]|nr:hypothetical protein [Psychrosphaera sp.]